jgi:aspartate/tyrosine/aromatic aminotransferase
MSSRQGVWAATPQQPPTVIFHLTARFKADSHPKKLNLGVGAYRDDALQPVVFSAVRKAEAAVVAAGYDKEYLPITGLPAFTVRPRARRLLLRRRRAAAASVPRHAPPSSSFLHASHLSLQKASARLLFGADCAALNEGRVATCQTLSGTGALTVAAHLVRRTLPGRPVYISSPTWENHGKVLADAGIADVRPYRYWDGATRGLDWAGLQADLEDAPEGALVLLHGCAHNPTGVDPSGAQWAALAALCARKRLLPWFDVAYQGFASGDLDADAAPLRAFAAAGLELLACQSFAKNFGLYCERVGALHVLAADAASAAAALSTLEAIVRPMYSNPPAHGARVVAAVLGDAALNAEWRAQLAAAMARIQRMRALTAAAIAAKGTPGDWTHIVRQQGMFSFTGLDKAQATRMVEDFHIYMLDSGRINVAGLNDAAIPIFVDALDKVVRGLPA